MCIRDSIKSYEKAIAIKPDYAEAHNNLGIVLMDLDQPDEAVKCYDKAIAIKPDYAEAFNNLGTALKEVGQLNAAAKCYKKAIAITPDYAKAHHNLGATLKDLGQPNEAVKCYEKAIAIKPDYAGAHNNLAIFFKDIGQLDEAVKNFEKALSINPEYAQVYRQLGAIKKYTESDPSITQMKSILSNSDLSQSNRIHLCFALAKAYEDLGKQDELFKFLHEGNRLRKQELNYSIDTDKIRHSVVKKLFSSSPSFVEKSFSYETSTIRPVFILGMPRSGTSLVEEIIASHHAVYGAGELNNLSKLIIPIVKDHSTNNKNGLSEDIFLSIRQQYLDSVSYTHLTLPTNREV